MGWKLRGKAYECMGRQARGLQSVRLRRRIMLKIPWNTQKTPPKHVLILNNLLTMLRCAKCANPRKVRGPTQSVRAHAKCAGCVMGTGDAKCADVREMRGPRFNCAGRTECAGRNGVERWVGRTAYAPPPHLPFNAHAMQPRFHSSGPRWAAIAQHVKG